MHSRTPAGGLFRHAKVVRGQGRGLERACVVSATISVGLVIWQGSKGWTSVCIIRAINRFLSLLALCPASSEVYHSVRLIAAIFTLIIDYGIVH